MRMILTVFALAALIWLNLSKAAASDISAAGEAMKAIVTDPAEYKRERASGGSRIEKLFAGVRKELKEDRLRALDSASLEGLENVLRQVCLFRSDKVVASDYGRLFRELESRKLVTRENSGYLQLAYIDARMFAEAAELATKYPQYDLNEIPEVVDVLPPGARRRVFEIDPVRSRLTAVSAAAADKSVAVVYVGSLYCNISRNAVDFISGNEKLNALSKNFIALSSNFVPAQLAKWNREHQIRFGLPYAKEDWPELDLNSTPGIYILRDGKVLFHEGGWDAFSGIRLAEGLRESGLLDFDAFVGTLRYAADSLFRRDEPYETKAAVMWRTYELLARQIRQATLARAGPAALETAFHLVADAMLNGSGTEPLKELEMIFSELKKRGAVKNETAESLYDYYLDARDFKAAKKLAGMYPGLRYSTIPEVTVADGRGATGRGVYEVGENGRTAKLSAFEFGPGPQIIVTGVPSCGATKRAFYDLEREPALKKIFSENAVFLTWNSDFARVAVWNKARATKALIAHRKRDWPEFTVYSSPVFYFLKDGKVLGSARGGWGDKAGMAEKLAGLRAIGLSWEAAMDAGEGVKFSTSTVN